MTKLLALCGLMLAATSAGAQPLNPAYLREMPPPERILSEIRAVDPDEQAARQMGAFLQLNKIIDVMSEGRWTRNQLTPDELRIKQQYRSAVSQVQKAQGIPDARLEPTLRGYDLSPELRDDLLNRYFSPAFRTQYSRIAGDTNARLAPRPKEPPETLPGPTSPVPAPPRTEPPEEADQGGLLAGLWALVVGAVQVGSLLLALAIAGAAVVAFAAYKIKTSRYFTVRGNNREALQVLGADQATREQAIIDAFDSPDHTFRYAGAHRVSGLFRSPLILGALVVGPLFLVFPVLLLLGVPVVGWMLLNGGNKMRFVLLRNIKSFSRGDLEALRFAYLAFNRGLIDDEKFHWYRFSAIYAGGKTDPAEWKFPGVFKLFKSTQGDIEKARTTIASFAETNGGTDIESQALAAIQKLSLQHPGESLFHDTRRRFVEGSYWLTRGELKRSAFAPADHPYGVTFGVLEGTDTELVYAGEGSIMTIAPPGAGKTQCNVFPNLLRWPGPAVVLDVKGEIYDKTSLWRAANVGPVIKFSPLDPLRSARYNPLSVIRNESFYLWEDARYVANMMIVPQAKDPFWEDKAREVLTAIIADVAFWNKPEERGMSKVLRLVNRNGWNDFIDRMQNNPEIETMRDEGANLAQMEPKTLDGALQTAKASLSAWVGERIAQTTRQSDWTPLDLRNGTNPTLYVCVKPNEIDAYLSLLRVVIAQHIRALCSELPPHGAAPILFVLDELPRLKYMPPVEEALEVGRQYGIRLWMFAQSLGQMKAAYVNGEGMMGSCAVRTFMNPSLQDGTAKMLAEQIGHRTGEEHGGKEKTANAETLVVTATQLAGAEFKELQIVLGTGTKPAKVRKMYAHRDPALVAKMGAVQDTGSGRAVAAT
jgi:type IV secretion system protein VirD4